MPTPLLLRLHPLSIDFAHTIAGMIGEMTIEELLAQTAAPSRSGWKALY